MRVLERAQLALINSFRLVDFRLESNFVRHFLDRRVRNADLLRSLPQGKRRVLVDGVDDTFLKLESPKRCRSASRLLLPLNRTATFVQIRHSHQGRTRNAELLGDFVSRKSRIGFDNFQNLASFLLLSCKFKLTFLLGFFRKLLGMAAF